MFLGKTHVHVSYGWIWLLQNLYSCIYILWKKEPYKKQLYWQSPTTFSPVLIIFFCTYVYEYTLSSNFENCHWINFPVIDVQFIMGQYFFLNQWYALLWFIWIMMVMIISEKDYKWIVYFFLQRLTSLKIEIAFHRLRQSLLACH